jgi:kynureninase
MFDRARELDAADPLASYRDRFVLPDDTIYLDGNSLGCLPKDTPARIAEVVAHEWGRDLIGSWNTADWIVMPRSRSCSIQSVTVLPSCTSPILCERPV